jgi:peptidoglycan/xylan/chitin deacetylase (PgdA/CDA1 family)/glycosyltransferase involved in cell wall biosynthesis
VTAGPRDDGGSLSYSVVMPTKDRPGLASNAVAAMLEQTRLPVRIVVVDASRRPYATSAALERRAAERGVELLVVREEPSTSGQRNRGVCEVETPIVLFLDDDIDLDRTYAESLLRRWERDGLAALGGVVGSRMREPESRLQRLLRWLFQLHMTSPRARATTLRRSRKVRYVDRPATEVFVPVVGAGAVSFRADLVRRHPFNERFHGYALGEDLEMSSRLAQEAPILQVPDVSFRDTGAPGSQGLAQRWYYRGRRESYFRLLHLRRRPLDLAAFGLSIVGETVAAAADAVRERDPSHVHSFVLGLSRTVGEFQATSLKPTAYYVAGHRYHRLRVRARRRGAVPDVHGVRIFGYHRITTDRDLLAVTPEAFRRHLELALANGLLPLGLDQALDRLETPADGGFFCVTLDDGYLDVLENAVPILRELGIPATSFVPTAVIDGAARFTWYESSPPVMSWAELRELDADPLFDVQPHGRTHVLLTRLAEPEARAEIFRSKDELEARLGRTVTALCYPAGLYGEREMRLVREAGFRAGVTCDPGVAQHGVDFGALPRTMISGLDTTEDFEAKLAGLLDERSGLSGWLYRRRSAPEHSFSPSAEDD